MTRVVSLYFVRHGHADHNAAVEKYGEYAYWDPVYTNARLTEKGIMQSKNLNNFFKDNNPDIVFSSSLRRCLETILLKLNMAKYTMIGNELKNLSFPLVMNEGLVKTLLTDKSKSSEFSDYSRKMMYI